MADLSLKIRRSVKEYILNEFLPGEDPDSLSDDTPLITSSILDSINILKLVVFIEETHGVEFQTQEVTAECLDTLERIARTVQAKIGKDA